VKAGLARATDNRDPWSWYPALEAVTAEAASGRTFEAFDLEERYGVTLDHPNRWGALFSSAAGQGLIEHVGYAKSRRPSRSGGLCRTWRGVLR